MDSTDRQLLAELQRDATQPYARLGETVGLSAGSAHDRVRKLRDRGIIRRTTVEIDPAAVGKSVLAFVLVEGDAWLGDAQTAAALDAIREIEEAHIIAGPASVLVKVRTTSTQAVQDVLRRIFAIESVRSTQTIVVLESLFERPPDPLGQT